MFKLGLPTNELIRFWRAPLAGLAMFVTLVGVFYVSASLNPVVASSITYPEYNVELQINKDSTLDVTETLHYQFTGEFQGVIRRIPLNNVDCISGKFCGGFDHIAMLEVSDDKGTKYQRGEDYEVTVEENEDTEERFLQIKQALWSSRRDVTGEEFTWVLKYRVYGSLVVALGNQQRGKTTEFLYWNALPSERGGVVKNSTLTVKFPDNHTSSVDNLEVYSEFTSSFRSQIVNKELKITTSNLSDGNNFTVAYELPEGMIIGPAQLVKYNASLPWAGINITIDGVNLGDLDGEIKGFPGGRHKIDFSAWGYKSKSIEVNVTKGQILELDASLEPEPWMAALIAIMNILNIGGLCLLPIGMLLGYFWWRSKGRDEDPASTIIPLFSPPEGVRPYLLGSLKDESVDKEDIVGSIIDLAYRGYLKIVEYSKRKYRLVKLKEADDELTGIETKLFNALFYSDSEVTLSELAGDFYAEYLKLQSGIYTEMVDKGYFKTSPQVTRGIYIGMGILLVILGVIVGIFVGLFAIGVIGYIGPVSIGLLLAAMGGSVLIAANHMPAKTSLGSKVFAEVKGFKMYLHTAERYRLQDLGPEEFERYLSYAIVFGIEKEWAKKFADIYKGSPAWLEAQSNDTLWDAYFISNFTRSFSNSMSTTSFTPPTSSASGSGWSGGGGSFGGSSGGGGGGGSSGGF